MQKRLNGWQRIGLVISVLWLLLIGMWAAIECVQKGEQAYYFFETTKINLPVVNESKRLLTDEEVRGYRIERHFRPERLIITMFISIALFWILVYVGVYVVRWIVAGFKKT